MVILLFRLLAGFREAGRAHRPVAGDGLRAVRPSCRDREKTGEGGLEEAGCAGGGAEGPKAAGDL